MFCFKFGHCSVFPPLDYEVQALISFCLTVYKQHVNTVTEREPVIGSEMDGVAFRKSPSSILITMPSHYVISIPFYGCQDGASI